MPLVFWPTGNNLPGKRTLTKTLFFSRSALITKIITLHGCKLVVGAGETNLENLTTFPLLERYFVHFLSVATLEELLHEKRV